MIKAIVKTEECHGLALFFPEYAANPGMIIGFSLAGGHFEACMDYFWECKTPRIEQSQEIEFLISYYASLGGFEPVKRIYRDSQKMRDIRYKWNFKG